jgi:hypothetical protein
VTDRSPESLEPWQLRYVQTALWFLSLPHAEKAGYLPPRFPAVLFHGDLGDFTTGNPLYFMVQFCGDACRVGARVEDWMDLEPRPELAERFGELGAILTVTLPDVEQRDGDAFVRSLESLPGLRGLFNAARRYARDLMADLGWSVEPGEHTLSCVRLLDEYSYGAYSASAARAAEEG